jgi:hypothetical protein
MGRPAGHRAADVCGDRTMYAIKTLAPVMLAVGLLTGAGTQARADTYYAAVAINNPTDHTLYYQFRWGPNNQWQSYSVAPHSMRSHFWPYDYPNQNHSPVPQIRFHYNPAERQPRYKVYDLQAWAVAYAQAPAGKPYSFRYSWGGGYLDVYQG